MEGRTRAGRRIRQRAEEVDGECQSRAEGGEERYVTERRAVQGRARQDMVRQGRARQSRAGLGKAGYGARRDKIWRNRV